MFIICYIYYKKEDYAMDRDIIGFLIRAKRPTYAGKGAESTLQDLAPMTLIIRKLI